MKVFCLVLLLLLSPAAGVLLAIAVGSAVGLLGGPSVVLGVQFTLASVAAALLLARVQRRRHVWRAGLAVGALQAVLDDKYLVEAAQEQSRNSEFPVVWAFSNIVDSNVPGCKTGTRSDVFNRKMGVGQKLPFTLGSQKFELLRENDIDNARLFRLRVLAS